MNGAAKPRGTKGEVFRTESGATAPVRTFPLRACSGSTQVIACRTPRDERRSPLSTAHEKRKFTAMGLPAVCSGSPLSSDHLAYTIDGETRTNFFQFTTKQRNEFNKRLELVCNRLVYNFCN